MRGFVLCVDNQLVMSSTCYLFVVRERPFNLKGGYGLFSKKNILIPNVAEKNILILVEEEKKNNLIQFLSYNLMLNSGGEKNSRHDKIKKYSNSYCPRKKF